MLNMTKKWMHSKFIGVSLKQRTVENKPGTQNQTT
uniref:Uncharacterized protein n=1 Tax=Anguilla anguilla TaxID=7936 RepID=A0A0E9VTT5_ANGAN